MADTIEVFEPNGRLRIDSRGQVTLRSFKSEMGQGVWTSLATIIAEELDADWTSVVIERAPVVDGDSSTETGGSISVQESWTPLRLAGASARLMLVVAAATRWNATPEECATSNGVVTHPPTGRQLRYGELVAAASQLPVPRAESVKTKNVEEFVLVGKPLRRRDTPDKITGRAQFGMDVRVHGMRFASVERCPVRGGTLASAKFEQARAKPGVLRVERLAPMIEPGGTATILPHRIAVIANSTWSALQGRRALQPEWNAGANGAISTDTLWKAGREVVDSEGIVTFSRGDALRARGQAARILEATYELPFLAHAPMEPMNCTAHVQANRVDIWAPTQFPHQALQQVAQYTGLTTSQVHVHVTFMGGGFGRRAYQDFVLEAVELSKLAGVPVQVTWTREDDMRHGFYRPMSLQRLRAALDADGELLSWENRVVGPSTQYFWRETTRQPARREQATQVPFDVPSMLLDFVRVPCPLALGAWRSVSNSQNAFCVESFVDEIAHARGMDPLALRLELLREQPAMQRVVRLAAEKADWNRALPKGRGRGLAFFAYPTGTHVAQVAEVRAEADDTITVERVVCAFDCGLIVNPDTVRAQIEGSIVWGLSSVLYGEITLEGGSVVQSNFHDYPVLRMHESPAIEIHLVTSSESPKGVGEPAVPPLAPAVTNAVFAATGKRIRRLPLLRK